MSDQHPEVITPSVEHCPIDSDIAKLKLSQLTKVEKNAKTALEKEIPADLKGSESDSLEIPGTQDSHIEHQNFCQKFIANDNLGISQFTAWISAFRESPQIVSTVVQSYAAVLIARENRIAKMHEDFCQMVTAKYNASTMWKVMREKCRTETIREYLKEKYANQRHNIDAWKDVVKTQQVELTKRVESMEVTKRLVEKQGMSQNQAVLTVIMTAFLGTSGLFRIGRGSGLLIISRRKLMLMGFVVFLYKHFEQVRNQLNEMGIAGLAATYMSKMMKITLALTDIVQEHATKYQNLQKNVDASVVQNEEK